MERVTVERVHELKIGREGAVSCVAKRDGTIVVYVPDSVRAEREGAFVELQIKRLSDAGWVHDCTLRS